MATVHILGAGIGGLAAGLALQEHGFQPRIFEQAAALSEVGAGIQISPNGMVVLRALGLGPAIEAKGQRARQVRLIEGETGRDVARLPLAGRDYHFLHRADLIDILAEAAKSRGLEITLGHRAQAVYPGINTGASFVLGDQRLHSDWLIGADGLHSEARDAVCPGLTPDFTGQIAWRALIPAQSEEAPEVRVYMGAGRHIVRYPLRQGRLINIVAVEERTAWAAEGWHHEAAPPPVQKAFASFCPEIRADLARLEQVHLWGLHRHRVAPDWHDKGVVLMGDAAHPTLPFLAQGANMALEDAWVLAACLANGSGPAAYQAKRKARTTRITEAAQKNATNYHLPPGPKRRAAHMALRLASATAPGLLTARFNWLYSHDVTRTS